MPDQKMISIQLWQYRLWSFQTGGTKLERFLPKNQHKYSKKIIEFWELHFKWGPQKFFKIRGKTFSIFVLPLWKLHNPYCHNPNMYSLVHHTDCSSQKFKWQKWLSTLAEFGLGRIGGAILQANGFFKFFWAQIIF